MIDFNKNSNWNLKPIDVRSVQNDVKGLLIDDEEICIAFQTIRDQLIFTNKRIITVEMQGVTGKKKAFSTLPYSKIQYFTVQTPGFMELFPDSELFLTFTNGFTAKFEFKGQVDIGTVGRIISEYVLK